MRRMQSPCVRVRMLCLARAGTGRARRRTLASTPTHPLLAAQADNILVYTHPAPHFAPKHFTFLANPPPPDIAPLCLYWRIQKNLYIVLMSLMIIEDGYGLG
jgi:hypothetical protein